MGIRLVINQTLFKFDRRVLGHNVLAVVKMRLHTHDMPVQVKEVMAKASS